MKAATITPEGADDVGSPNRLLREAIDGKVIIRTGRRIPGVTPIAGVHYPIAVVRMAVGRRLRRRAVARGGGRRRGGLPHRANLPQRLPGGVRVRVPHGLADPRTRVRRPQVDGEPGVRGDAQGGDGRRRRAPSRGALQPRADRRHLRRPDLGRRRCAARDPGAEPRWRLPLGPGHADVRVDRGSRVGAARVRRRLRAPGGDGRGPARHRARPLRERTSRTRWR